ncbi:hypothetical protein OH77DRAFT_1427554 [Trametes cingulata]|nr:hypothetical protein OH77DRAFT_1427554 [Trametes cingulata]
MPLFMAHELLLPVVCPSRWHALHQTPAHDLQSFCWLIVYLLYKVALEPRSIERLGWTIEEVRALKNVYNEVFAAPTIEKLLMQRSYRLGRPPGYADIRSEETISWGIVELMNYCTTTAQDGGEYLLALLEVVWDVLQRSEPKIPRKRMWKRYGFFSSKEDGGEGQEDGDKGAQTMNTPSLDSAPGPLSSPEHACLIHVLETLLTYMEAS